jgi:asparagine synthase (glutamine-hydrolysing)
MGGIAGVMSRRRRAVDPDVLVRLSSALAHRGRGADGRWAHGPIGLVHRPDTVSPPVCEGSQPLHDPSGRYTIVCDGRIYNAREVAKDLSDAGVSLRAGSILEVMLQAFVAWGTSAFAHLNGDFACGIWDEGARRLVLARDHFGVKPLYYHVGDDLVVFGSEIKAVLAHPECRREPDEAGIASYLTFDPYAFPAERTVYRHVRKASAAHVVTADEVEVATTPYWTLDPARVESRVVDAEGVRAIGELVTDAVRIRLPDGDRLGAALTGGFDSSSIVCIMRHLDRVERGDRASLDTFSFDFGSDDADEVALIDRVAGRVGARHHHIDALRADLLRDLDDVIRAGDGPVLEPVVLLLWRKKQAAREQGIEVLLSGLGGDEVFMGTPHFLADLLRQGRWLELWREIRGMYPVDRSTGHATSLPALLRAYVLGPLMPDWLRRMRQVHHGRPFPPDWIAPALVARTGLAERWPASSGTRLPTVFSRWAYDLLNCGVVNGAVPSHDVCSAAFGVATRFPFLDVRLVEALFAVPRPWKIHRGQVRPLQRQALAPWLPPEVLEEHVKKNFQPAMSRFVWQTCRAEFDRLLGDDRAVSRKYLDWPRLRQHYDRVANGAATDLSPLWGALNLERWLRANWG